MSLRSFNQHHRSMLRVGRKGSSALSALLIVTLLVSLWTAAGGQQIKGAKVERANARTAPYQRQPSRAALKWADAELRRMTLDEKIGQMIAVGINATFLNQESAEFKELRRQVEQN